jgi:hypothetical protein
VHPVPVKSKHWGTTLYFDAFGVHEEMFSPGASGPRTTRSASAAQQVTGPGSQVYWTANALDAELRLTRRS